VNSWIERCEPLRNCHYDNQICLIKCDITHLMIVFSMCDITHLMIVFSIGIVSGCTTPYFYPTAETLPSAVCISTESICVFIIFQ